MFSKTGCFGHYSYAVLHDLKSTEHETTLYNPLMMHAIACLYMTIIIQNTAGHLSGAHTLLC